MDGKRRWSDNSKIRVSHSVDGLEVLKTSLVNLMSYSVASANWV
jgi:hypothetical protein